MRLRPLLLLQAPLLSRLHRVLVIQIHPGSTTPGFKPGDNATVTLVFREPVTFFSSDDDISHPYGDLTTMTSSDNITWTGIFTPTSNSQDYSNRFSLANSYKDVAGNTGTAGNNFLLYS